MPLNELQKTFQCGESLASEDLNSIVQAINNTVTAVNTIKNNLEGHQYDVSVPITSIYCRTKKNINASGFFPQSDAQKVALFEEVTNCQLTQGIKYNVNFLTVTLDNIADNMNGVWTAYPQGITEELPHEWEASFKKLEDSNEVIFMFGPVLVSNYGFSGADGDGVQYVYKLFDHELTEIERTANTPVKPASPNQNGEYIPSGWFDDPQGTTSEYPYEYVATLKRTNGSWGDFEKIALWGTYSEDGINGDFQTRVFCRFNPTALKLAPNKPLGGTYDSPQPGSNDSIAWSMTVPSGDGLVWTSTRTFKGDGTVTDWSTPVIESDSNELDIEYSSSATKPSVDTLRGTPGVPHPSNNVWHDPSESGIDLSSMVWRAERKIKNKVYEGNWVITRIQGERGSDAVLTSEQVQILAKAGLEIIINPQNITLDQSGVLISASDDKIDNDFTVNISVYKNGTILNTNDYQINSNSVQMYGNGSNDPFVNTSNAFFEVQSKAIVIKNLPITTNNNQYTYTYNKGYIKGTIAVILEGTTYNVPFNIPWYLNKLGERIEKLKGDISETYLSRDVFTNDHANKTIKQEFDAYINQSAQGTIEQYSKNVGLVDNNGEINVPTLQSFGEFQRDATSNISKLSKSITGTNLLSDNWTTFSSPVEITTGSGVTMERRVTKVSPQIPLSEGIYILSCYSTQTSPNNFKVSIGTSASKISGNIPYITNNDITWQYYGIGNSSGNLSGGRLSSNQETEYEGDYYTRTENSSEVTYVRFYCRIIVNTEQYYSFVISTSTGVNSTYPVIRPQLELCLATNTEQFPTPWVPGPQDFSSEIKQTAEAITSTVSGLSNNISQVQQTADNITSQVTQLQKGKNLLSGAVSGKHWKSTTPTGQAHTIEGIDSDGFITAKSGDVLLRHPDITIKKNTYYTLSLYSKNTSAFNFLINSPNSDFTEFSVEVPSGTQSTRRSVSFKVEMEGTGNVSIRPIFQTTTIQYPQIEIGSTATEFETSFAEIGSKITQDINSISFEVNGVTESQLQTVGIYLTGNNAGIRMQADNFRLEDSNQNLVFGKESADSSNITFSGDIKNGTSGDGFDGAYTNEIRVDGTGNLGGRLIEWDPDYGLYIGPGPSSGYENYDVMSDIYKPSGDDYNGDGIRVFPNGRIHFQGQMDGNFKFGKIGMEGSSGRISIYGEGVDSASRKHNIFLSKDGLAIRPQVFTSSEDILEYGAPSAYNKTDAGAINFGSTPDVGANNAINWNNPNVPANQSIAGDTGNPKKYNQRIYIKGCDGFIYQGYTGISNNLCFINGICIGPSSGFNSSSDYMNMNILFPS